MKERGIVADPINAVDESELTGDATNTAPDKSADGAAGDYGHQEEPTMVEGNILHDAG